MFYQFNSARQTNCDNQLLRKGYYVDEHDEMLLNLTLKAKEEPFYAATHVISNGIVENMS